MVSLPHARVRTKPSHHGKDAKVCYIRRSTSSNSSNSPYEFFGTTCAYLKEAVDRIISDFTQIAVKLKIVNRRQNFTKLFLSNTGYVNTNYCPVYVTTYHIHLARWLKLFPQTQIHFVDGDRLISEPLQELRAVKKSCGFPHFSQRM